MDRRTTSPLLQKLRQRRGLADMPVLLGSILILFAIVALAVNLYPAFVLRSGIQDAATETVRYIELRGQTEGAETEFNRICQIYGIENASIDIDGEFSEGTKLQLQSAVTVTVKTEYKSGLFTIPLTARATGRSEVYWKK